MGQIFRPVHNTLALVSVLALAGGPPAVFYLGSTISRSPSNTKVGIPLNQPIPFSHKHHVNELGIDCRFCHSSVETSAVAGIPATQVCMTCHSQIWTNSPVLEPLRRSYETGQPIKFAEGDVGWTRVNKVPEFVFFDHSIHIQRGVNCNHCHGAVQEMHITAKGKPLAMSWCLECHREPEKHLYVDPKAADQEPRQQVFNLYRKFQAGEQLTAVEHSLKTGEGQLVPQQKIEQGKMLVKARGIKVKQLEDCWICHR